MNGSATEENDEAAVFRSPMWMTPLSSPVYPWENWAILERLTCRNDFIVILRPTLNHPVRNKFYW